MKKLVTVITCLTVLASTASAASLRLFFTSTSGNPGSPPRAAAFGSDPAVPSTTSTNWPGSTSTVTNPALATPVQGNPSVAGGRLYLWATGDGGGVDPDGNPIINQWIGVAFSLNVVGPATISSGGLGNVRSPISVRRWNSGSDMGADGNFAYNLTAVSDGTNGLRFSFQGMVDSGINGYDGWSDNSTSYLLGYWDFAANGGTSQVFLGVGQQGIARSGGDAANDEIFFGTGDAALRGNQFGARSSVEDATITPEPASLALLALAGLMIRRR